MREGDFRIRDHPKKGRRIQGPSQIDLQLPHRAGRKIERKKDVRQDQRGGRRVGIGKISLDQQPPY